MRFVLDFVIDGGGKDYAIDLSVDDKDQKQQRVRTEKNWSVSRTSLATGNITRTKTSYVLLALVRAMKLMRVPT